MASPVDTSVKFYSSDMAGAPVLNGVAGSLIAILDACLVNGFGSKAVTTLVVAGGIATMTFSGGASAAQVGAVILVAGATPSALNGEQKVLSASSTAVTFATDEDPVSATGSITFKIAAAGWAKPFTGTNLAAYQSLSVEATDCYLRVDDTNTQNARVWGYQTMSTIDVGTGVFPLESQVPGGDYWTKSGGANSTANRWFIFADDRMIYFARAYRDGAAGLTKDFQLSAFGDFLPTKSGDPFGCIISGENANVSSAAVSGVSNYWYGQVGASTGLYCPRSYTGLGASIPMGKSFPTLNGHTSPAISGAHAQGTPFPNPTDGGVYVVPHYLFEATSGGSNNVHRGVSPGFYCTPQSIPNDIFNPGDVITGVAGLVGKALKAVTCTNGTRGVVFFDITGPWR